MPTKLGRTEFGPSDDTLRVFALATQGKLSGPLWSSEMKDGLDAPTVPLFRSLKEAVDRAYPPQSASQATIPAAAPNKP